MRVIKAFLTAVIALVMIPGCFCVSSGADSAAVEPIEFANPDFIRGMDVSSVLSLEKSGVVFRDTDGKEEDLFRILADSGVNYIRVRVWNDPFDSDGHGYGGGNCDTSSAARIGRRAADCGMRLLVDFHYSDFWADPAKQKAPKAWSAMSVSEKAESLYDFTFDSLKEIKEAGADIGMVQIGNEINSGIAGVYDRADVSTLLKAGIKAVRDFDPDVLTAVHFTNPEKSEYIKSLADDLNARGTDYDVFAVSYYPYWHGSLENLTEVLGYVSDTYGKYVMVAETSYAYTLFDTDGHPNTVSEWSNSSGADLIRDFTVQGQAEEVRSVMAAVNAVGEKGLGVFYWEGAWITVGDTTGLSGSAYDARVSENKELWEKNGCGWAASYSGEFDPDDAGMWFGGSAVDNQAFFDAGGKALPSLRVFSDVVPHTEILLGDADGSGEVDVIDASFVQRRAVNIPVVIPESTLMQGDVNSDGELDSLDATFILRYATRVPTPYPIGERVFPNILNK